MITLKSKQSYSDTLDSHFANTVTAAIFLEDRGAYETLTNKGRELITNDSLRTSLASLYAHDYTYLKRVEKIDFDHMVNNVAHLYLFASPAAGFGQVGRGVSQVTRRPIAIISQKGLNSYSLSYTSFSNEFLLFVLCTIYQYNIIYYI
ncbi:MAG: hypothetical protein U5J63_01880 [Fodinibius sp.]|nr:hypothetical protein [Fodinibius sp.]